MRSGVPGGRAPVPLGRERCAVSDMSGRRPYGGGMICGLFLLVLCGSPAGAATFDDYERARDALEREEILPLADILARVEAEFDLIVLDLGLPGMDGLAVL